MIKKYNAKNAEIARAAVIFCAKKEGEKLARKYFKEEVKAEKVAEKVQKRVEAEQRKAIQVQQKTVVGPIKQQTEQVQATVQEPVNNTQQAAQATNNQQVTSNQQTGQAASQTPAGNQQQSAEATPKKKTAAQETGHATHVPDKTKIKISDKPITEIDRRSKEMKEAQAAAIHVDARMADGTPVKAELVTAEEFKKKKKDKDKPVECIVSDVAVADPVVDWQDAEKEKSVAHEAQPAAATMGFNINNFVQAKVKEPVDVGAVNGSAFVRNAAPEQTTILPPQTDGVVDIELIHDFIKNNPNLPKPYDPRPDVKGATAKLNILKKNIKFMEGLGRQIDVIQINSLMSLIAGANFRSKMSELGAVDRPRDPKLVEVPVDKYDASGRFDFAFEQKVRDRGKIMVVLFQSVPSWNPRIPSADGQMGAWVNDTSIFKIKDSERNATI